MLTCSPFMVSLPEGVLMLYFLFNFLSQLPDKPTFYGEE